MHWLASLVGVALAFTPQSDGVIRLKPRDFRQLPLVVRRDLDRRGCTIPQFPLRNAPHNVITGSFFAKGSRDWAVLCSVKQGSRILVYRDGSVGRVDSLARRDDAAYIQNLGSGVFGFSRIIEIASAKSITDHAKIHDGPKPPSPLDHDGINDAFMEKGSTVLFFSRGKWLDLQGADD